MDDYYALLGVKEDASDLEIKTAYCLAAARSHPRHGQGDARGQEFTSLARAYWVLMDDAARGDYDAHRHGVANRRVHPRVSEQIDPHRLFVGSMMGHAIELLGQGLGRQAVQDTLLSILCPESIVRAIVATLPGSASNSSIATNTATNPPVTGITGNQGGQAKNARPSAHGALYSGAVVATAVVGLILLSAIFSSQKQTTGPKAVVNPQSSAPTAEAESKMGERQEYPATFSALSAFQHFDSNTGVGTRNSSSFKLPAGETLPTMKSGAFRTEVALRQPLPGDQRVLYLFKSVPIQSDKYDCHACAVVMSAVITSKSTDGVEKTISPMQDLGLMGAWGKYDVSSVALVEVGKNRPGLVFPYSWMAQGYSGSSVEIYSIEAKGLKSLGRFDTNRDSSGSAACQENKLACEKYEVSLQFMKDAKSTYYTVELKESGMKKDATGDTLPTHSRYVARYSGKSYIVTRVAENEQAVDNAVDAGQERNEPR
ncbi:J domain-containing protein [Cupriavidus oxalaticus]|nr:J domain-containing protein [Cupriavidus oxalaticus]